MEGFDLRCLDLTCICTRTFCVLIFSSACSVDYILLFTNQATALSVTNARAEGWKDQLDTRILSLTNTSMPGFEKCDLLKTELKHIRWFDFFDCKANYLGTDFDLHGRYLESFLCRLYLFRECFRNQVY
jgi:hypothetical protein